MAKILGLSSSPRKNCSTEYFVKEALNAISDLDGVETSYMTLAGKNIQPCIHCDYCKREKSWCILKDDGDELIKEFVEADAYIIGSPVYAYAATPQIHAFISRMRPLHHVFPGKIRNKFAVCMSVGGTRNGGQEATVTEMINMLMARSINIVSNEAGGYLGAYLWSKDKKAEGAKEDEAALENCRKLAKKLAEVAVTYEAGKKALSKED